jgi:hypothetical protein
MTQEALKLALEALEEAWYHVGTFQPTEKAIDLYDEARTAIKEALAQEQKPVVYQCPRCATSMQVDLTAKAALAQPEQAPVKMVAYNCTCGRTMKFESVHGVVAPQRTWVGLTAEDVNELWANSGNTVGFGGLTFENIRAIEAKLKEKNR